MKAPNIIMALIDDFGYFGSGWQGNENANTPFMDRLVAEESLVLERHYTYKFCSPSRRSFLTGRFPPHSGQANGPDATIDYRMQTIAEMLKSANYSTYHMGKWHAGHFSVAETPHGRGFDESFGYFEGKQNHWTHVDSEDMCSFHGTTNVTDLWDTDKPTLNGEYDGIFGDFLFSSRVMEAIEKNDVMNPFFIYWAMQVAHDPMQAPDRFIDISTPDPVEYAFASVADEAMANVTTKLKALGHWNTTLLVFSSDNGGPAFSDQYAASNYPLRGGKYSLFEGGVRAVAFISGGFLPSERRGQRHYAPLHICDWFATFAFLAGVQLSPQTQDEEIPALDAVNQWPALLLDLNAEDLLPENTINRTFFLANGTILHNEFKFIAADAGDARWTGPLYPEVNATGPHALNCSLLSPCLFNIVQDPREMHDLAKSSPNMLAFLNLTLNKLMSGVFESISNPEHTLSQADVCNATVRSGGVLTPGDFYWNERAR